jgi:hypothetical protein
MKRLTLVAAVAALLVPAAALAKEPSQAAVSGPGFHKTFKANFQSKDFANTTIGRLTIGSGFFPAAMGQQPDPMLPGRPSGKLGPRYTIIWTVPMPGNTHRVRQDVYPYARGGAVTYMKRGQAIFDSKTIGGWYRAYGLKQTLLQAGLPASAPKRSSGMSLAWLGIPGALVLGGLVLALRRRHS